MSARFRAVELHFFLFRLPCCCIVPGCVVPSTGSVVPHICGCNYTCVVPVSIVPVGAGAVVLPCICDRSA